LDVPSIGVVGGGIGGLTAALACRHAGLDDVTVYEQVTEPEALGAGIQLSPNATRVLLALGLRGALAPVVFQPEAVHLRTWRTGYLVARRPLGALSACRYGAPYWHVHRGDLHALLFDAARERGIRIETGCRCRSAGEDERGPYVELESGTVR